MTPDEDTAANSRLAKLISGFSAAMVVSTDESGLQRGRPMAIANDTDGDDTGWLPPHRMTFVTHRQNTLSRTVDRQQVVSVTMQSERTYVFLSGAATLDTDRARISGLWRSGWDVWFKDGAADPDIVLVDCEMTYAEFWDGSGSMGLRYLLAAGKARLTGAVLTPDQAGAHAKIHVAAR